MTGSAGFVGRHMAAALGARGYQVTRCDVVTGIDCLDFFRTWPRSGRPFDLVIHCAARAPHRAAIDGQPDVFSYNAMLDAALFEWAMRTGQGRVLYLSSSAAYPAGLQGQGTARHLGEGDIDLGSAAEPDASYGWTKLTGERLALSARAAGVPVTVVRPFSGYGEDQGTDWPFGAFLERARRHEDPFTVWGDGTQVRDWIHIDDVVAGLAAVAESGTEDPVNLCTGAGTSMVDLIGLMTTAAGYNPQIVHRIDRPSGVAYRVGDPTRLNLYYTPKVSIQQGVKRALRAAVKQ